jgi:hypothetical protein
LPLAGATAAAATTTGTAAVTTTGTEVWQAALTPPQHKRRDRRTLFRGESVDITKL